VWGAVAGAVAFAVVGFSQLGWTLGKHWLRKMATQRALQPRSSRRWLRSASKSSSRQTDAVAKLVAFNKVSSSWDPPLAHREGRLGYHARKQHTGFGSCERHARKARQLDLETRPPIGIRRAIDDQTQPGRRSEAMSGGVQIGSARAANASPQGGKVHRRSSEPMTRANHQQDGHLHASVQSERNGRDAACGNLHGGDG